MPTYDCPAVRSMAFLFLNQRTLKDRSGIKRSMARPFRGTPESTDYEIVRRALPNDFLLA